MPRGGELEGRAGVYGWITISRLESVFIFTGVDLSPSFRNGTDLLGFGA